MRRLTLVSFLLPLVACGQVTEPAAPEVTDSNPLAPAFNFMNGPANPGNSAVMRAGLVTAFLGRDPDRGLVSVNNLGADDVSSSVFCGGDVDREVVPVQYAFDGGLLKEHWRGVGVTQHIWTQDDFDTDFCNLPPLAQGRGNYTLLDNHGKHGRSFGWTAQGMLTDPATGQRVHYSENQRAVQHDASPPVWTTEDIHLKWVGNAH